MPKGVYAHPRQPLAERFWPKVTKSAGCWLWNGALDGRGYGRIKDDAPIHTNKQAHRVSWELHFGPIPDGLLVCHRCDTPRCVRPDHLFLGTVRDNSIDMMAKGRGALRPQIGEKNGYARLTAASVRRIRTLAAAGVTHVAIGAEIGVTKSAVHHVLSGRTWKHVP